MPTKYAGKPAEVAALNAFIKFQRAQIQLVNGLAGHFAQCRLTAGQFGVLETLYHLGPLRPCDLGEKLLSSKPNISAVIGNLERDGLVRREQVAGDKRSVRVHLSAKGRKLIEKAFPDFVQYITGALGVLSAAELESFGALNKKLGLGLKK
jgi:MarR family 2-MHQ and catechol resistance regulon transcriptional repressor